MLPAYLAFMRSSYWKDENNRRPESSDETPKISSANSLDVKVTTPESTLPSDDNSSHSLTTEQYADYMTMPF